MIDTTTTTGVASRGAEEALSLSGVNMTFSGVRVLTDMRLALRAGEVHGLVGENGSGKSTLVRIISGIYTPDDGGECRVGGKRVAFPIAGPERDKIAVIHQDLAMVDGMSVMDNVGIASLDDYRAFAPIRKAREATLTQELMKVFGLTCDPNTPVGQLAPAERSIVKILRALRQLRHQENRGSILILDEPTAALSRSESDRLLSTIKTVARAGTAVLFISHHLKEVIALCDRISVLRSGELVKTMPNANVNERELVNLMLGYDLDEFYPHKVPVRSGECALAVDDLSGGAIEALSFQVVKGEVLGVTGLAGMGQDDIPYLLAGGQRRVGGHVRVDGATVGSSPRQAISAGVALVPANRGRDAIWGEGTAMENLTLPFVGRFSRMGFLRHRRERAAAAQAMGSFDVRPSTPSLEMSKFSGGNQQKLVMARTLDKRPKILILHEPTQGVDAGAKRAILGLVRRAADEGTAVILCSSDIEEVASMSDRVIVMRYGRGVAELTSNQITEDRIITLSQVADHETAVGSL